MTVAIDYRPMDFRIWKEELSDFVPNKIFDAHTHLWSGKYVPLYPPKTGKLPYVDLEVHRAWARHLYPKREIHFLMLGSPRAGKNVQGHNAFLAHEIEKDPLSRASMLVTPQIRPEEVLDSVDRFGFIGLKCYRWFSITGDSVECRITDYLPESLIQVANKRKLIITLHLAKRTGCADEENLEDLAYLTQKYPNVRWILAHCARSFAYWMIEQAIDRLKRMSNIFYDLSAVNDIMTFYLLFKHEKLERLLFASDNIGAGCAHSKYITFAKAWAYLHDGVFNNLDLSHCEKEPTLVIYEQLRAMKQAAEIVGFSKSDLEDLFYYNATSLLGIE